tara:strand:+ start:405 stop:548 length:144 start_codon:yes stop_codon:yes gene_type:complete
MKGKLMETIKTVGSIIGLLATVAFFWAAIWFVCLLSDTCYYTNFGGL